MTTQPHGQPKQLTQVCALAKMLANRMTLEHVARGAASMEDAVALLKAVRLLESYGEPVPEVVADVIVRLGAATSGDAAQSLESVHVASVAPSQAPMHTPVHAGEAEAPKPDDLSTFTFGNEPLDAEPRNVLQKLFRPFRAFERG